MHQSTSSEPKKTFPLDIPLTLSDFGNLNRWLDQNKPEGSSIKISPIFLLRFENGRVDKYGQYRVQYSPIFDEYNPKSTASKAAAAEDELPDPIPASIKFFKLKGKAEYIDLKKNHTIAEFKSILNKLYDEYPEAAREEIPMTSIEINREETDGKTTFIIVPRYKGTPASEAQTPATTPKDPSKTPQTFFPNLETVPEGGEAALDKGTDSGKHQNPETDQYKEGPATKKARQDDPY